MEVHVRDCKPKQLYVAPFGANMTRQLRLPAGTPSVCVKAAGDVIQVTAQGACVRSVLNDDNKCVKRDMEPQLKELVQKIIDAEGCQRGAAKKAECAARKAELMATHVEAQLAAKCEPTSGTAPSFADKDTLKDLSDQHMAVAAQTAEERASALADANRFALERDALVEELRRWLPFPGGVEPYDAFIHRVHEALTHTTSDCLVTLSEPAQDSSQLVIRSRDYNTRWNCELHLHVHQDTSRPSGYRASIDVDATLTRALGEPWEDIDIQFVTGYNLGGHHGPVPEPVRRKVIVEQSGSAGETRQRSGLFGAAGSVARSSSMTGGGTAPCGFKGVTVKGVTVRGDTVEQTIPLLRDVDLPVEVFRFAVPDKEEAAYMLISLTNTSGVELAAVPRACVFMDGTLVGYAHLRDCVAPGDTFTLAVGPDPAISVSQEKVPEVKAKEGMLFKSGKQELAQDIRLTGSALEHDTPLALLYPCPISTDSTVKVTQKQPAEATKLSGIDFEHCIVEALQKFTGNHRESFVEEGTGRYIDVVLVPKRGTVTVSRRRVIEHPLDAKLKITDSY